MSQEQMESLIKTKANEIAGIVIEKNRAYGNSFNDSEKILNVLYPIGIKPEQYKDMLAICRITDKLFRIANKKDAFNENPYEDITGYGLLGSIR